LASCYEVCDRGHELAGYFILGSLGSRQGVMIDGGIREAFLDKIERRRQRCRGCFCFYHCAGDCPAKTFSQASGEMSGSGRCRLNREITKNLLVRYIETGGGVWRGDLGGQWPAGTA
jgi:radical SAM protein with 4Fe4S-binding SPASM domain